MKPAEPEVTPVQDEPVIPAPSHSPLARQAPVETPVARDEEKDTEPQSSSPKVTAEQPVIPRPRRNSVNETIGVAGRLAPKSHYGILAELLHEYVIRRSDPRIKKITTKAGKERSSRQQVAIFAQTKCTKGSNKGKMLYETLGLKKRCVSAVHRFGVAFGCIQEDDPHFGKGFRLSKVAGSEPLVKLLEAAEYSHDRLEANAVDLDALAERIKSEVNGLTLPVFRFFAHYMHIKRAEAKGQPRLKVLEAQIQLKKQLQAFAALVAALKVKERGFRYAGSSNNVLEKVHAFLSDPKRFPGGTHGRYPELQRYIPGSEYTTGTLTQEDVDRVDKKKRSKSKE